MRAYLIRRSLLRIPTLFIGRLIFGARISVLVGLAVTNLSIIVSTVEAVGSSRWRSLIRHVVPNIMPVMIIFIQHQHMALASLGFLGYGLPPSIPDWGGMLSREGRLYMEAAPWLAIWPGLCLTITIYSLNMFGDAVRDLLDPRLRGGGRLGADAGGAGSV
ncbi:MAG: ABC transporter permease subunit [Spirochaetaceae bacterium]|nr:ABC transporter permease subunit [Spirochaetaceae bacterium]